MQEDIRETSTYREAEAFYRAVRQPGSGRVCDASDVHASPDATHAVFTGIVFDQLEGGSPTRICSINLSDGNVRFLTHGLNTDRFPRYSPDGSQIAYLSDRDGNGDFQLVLLNTSSGETRRTPGVGGWVEYLQWSPDGKRIILGVAAYGADVAGGQGAIASTPKTTRRSAWMPTVDIGDSASQRRGTWIFSLDENCVRQVEIAGLNIWDVAWCGNESLTAVVSDKPGEGAWYAAWVVLIDLKSHATIRDLYRPTAQIGPLAPSLRGNHIAIVEGISSDRGIVAGDLLLIDVHSQHVKKVDTAGVDVSWIEWRSEHHLLVAGHRDFDTVIGSYDIRLDEFDVAWCSSEISGAGRYISVSGIDGKSDCILIGEGFTRAPEIATVRAGNYHAIKSLDLGYNTQIECVRRVTSVNWTAPDGLPLQGWLLEPHGTGPFPLVMNVHGGPVFHWHSMWLGRTRYVPLCLLIRRGFAVFLPNPRGSTGRGQRFIGSVVGDMGGSDTNDFLSGIDFLVDRGIADRNRLGVTGVSYGGFISAWLITQDSRFSAAVPISPVTNWVSEHLISNIPHFVSRFLSDTYENTAGMYFKRSPVSYASKTATPTLIICGDLDRCTPPSEAEQFHRALLENGTRSVLVRYPKEGHGVNSLPAAIDFAARLVEWFDLHLGSGDPVITE